MKIPKFRRAAGSPSTSSSKGSARPDQPSNRNPSYEKLLESYEKLLEDVRILRSSLERVAAERDKLFDRVSVLETTKVQADFQLAEAAKAVQGLAQPREDSSPKIAPVGWLLAWAEYGRRKRILGILAPDALRPRPDSTGAWWRVHSKLPVSGPAVNLFGWDIAQPPHDEFILLTVQPERGRYMIAVDTLSRIEESVPRQIHAVANAEKAHHRCVEQGQLQEAERALAVLTNERDKLRDMYRRYVEAKAVVENAVETHFLIPVKAMEEGERDGMAITARVASVVPPRPAFLKIPEELQ